MTTYFVDEAMGNDSNNGQSESTPWKTISKVNGYSFSADDVIKFRCGDQWREELNPTASVALTFTRYGTGPNPLVNGADIVTGWTVHSGNVWKASFTPDGPNNTDVTKLFLDGEPGIEAANLAAVDSDKEWFYEGATTTIYLYSTSDPDTRFTDPGVEATSRDQCAYIQKIGITIKGINCTKSALSGIKFTSPAYDGEVLDLEISDTGENGFLATGVASNMHLSNVRLFRCGREAYAHGVYMNCPDGDNGPFLVEDCIAVECGSYGFQFWKSGSGQCVRSVAYNCRNGFVVGDSGDDARITLENCIAYGCTRHAFSVLSNGDTYENYVVQLLGCIGGDSDNNWYSSFYCHLNLTPGKVITRNCIWFRGDNTHAMDCGSDNTCDLDFDYNVYWRTGTGTMITFRGANYTQAQFSSYQDASGQDIHSISADPKFEDQANGDFHLQATSPCIEAGRWVNIFVDFDGISIPTSLMTPPCIGAYEYAA